MNNTIETMVKTAIFNNLLFKSNNLTSKKYIEAYLNAVEVNKDLEKSLKEDFNQNGITVKEILNFNIVDEKHLSIVQCTQAQVARSLLNRLNTRMAMMCDDVSKREVREILFRL